MIFSRCYELYVINERISKCKQHSQMEIYDIRIEILREKSVNEKKNLYMNYRN